MMPTLPNALPFTIAPEGVAKLAPDGAVEGDLFTQLLTQMTGGEGGELAALQPAAPDANLQQLILKSLPVAKAQVPLETGEAVGEEPLTAEQDETAATPEQELPSILAVLTAPVPIVQAQPPAQPIKVAASSLAAAPAADAIVPSSLAPLAAPPVETPVQSLEPAMAKAVAMPLMAFLPKAGGDQTRHERTVQQSALQVATGPAADTPLPDLAADAGPALQPPLPNIAAAAVAQPVSTEPAQASETPVIDRQLDLAHESEWLDQLAKDIARSASEDGRLRFNLKPAHLGTLQIELSQTAGGGTSVRMIADTDAARAIIADAQPRLVAEARAQGVRIAETHVDLGSGHSGDPRGQRGQQEETVRTFRLSQTETPAAPEPARAASERYA